MDLYFPPKYNDWINNRISPFLKDFPKDRKIRVICPRQVNTLLLKQHSSNTLRRSDRVLCCPPTHECLWKLEPRDGPWIKEVFQDIFATIIPPQSMALLSSVATKAKRHQLWVKVVHVEQLTADTGYDSNSGSRLASKNLQEKRTRKDIFVVDKSSDTEPALISLYDQQAYLTRMIERGDYLGIVNPVVAYRHTESQATQADIVFECGPETVLFVMSNSDAVEAGVAKVQPLSDQAIITEELQEDCHDDIITSRESATSSQEQKPPVYDFWHQQKSTIVAPKRHPIMRRDDEGLMDCLTYVPRLLISDLEQNMLNITISGQVVAKANNASMNVMIS
jgi:hypothetical protein